MATFIYKKYIIIEIFPKKILNIMLPDTLSKFLQLYENKKIT